MKKKLENLLYVIYGWPPSSTVQIFVEGLPLDSKVPELQKYFQSVGPIKCDRETRKPRVWLYHDKGCFSDFYQFPESSSVP